MAVKPLEKPRSSSLYLKIALVILLIAVGFAFERIYRKNASEHKQVLGTQTDIKNEIHRFGKDVVDRSLDQANRSITSAFGEAGGYISSTASKSAEIIGDFVFDSTLGNIIKQIDRLPEKQKEDVKKAICQ
ncbi:DNA recombination protein RmuC [Candidatus Roizmanbacteria bacterium]|jgi:hypothetical protein|nr:DNA recombination protein RmuC [Candidatus Roizmanbacteria bacterium]